MGRTQQQEEADLQEFRRLTRDEALGYSDAAERMGASVRRCRDYEKTLIGETGETRREHLLRRWKEVMGEGNNKTQAARLVNVPLSTLIYWESGKGDGHRSARPSTEAMVLGHAARSERKKKRLEAFRVLTREEGKTIQEACRLLGITTKTGNVYEHELTCRTGLTLRQHRLSLYREFREVLPRKESAEFMKIHRTTAADWDKELGLTEQAA